MPNNVIFKEFILQSAFRTTGLTLAVWLSAVMPALAASSSISVEHLHFQATDLDASDGIAAAVTAQPYNMVLAVDKGLNGHNSYFNDMAFTMRFANEVYEPTGPISYADGDISGTTQTFGADVLSASGWSAQASARTLNGTAGIAVFSGILINLPFMVTPHTQLRITANVPMLTYDDGDNGLSNARLAIQLSGDEIPWQTVTVFGGRCYANDICPVDGFPPPADPFDMHGPLDFTLTNSTDHYLSGYMYVSVRAFAENLAAPVPEPSGAALLLGGLAAIGARARRRQRLSAS